MAASGSLLLSRMPYVTQSRHGVWKYRRAVPEPLKKGAGRREIVVSLRTKNASEAELRAIQVHGQAETWLRVLRKTAAIDPRGVGQPEPEERLAADPWLCDAALSVAWGDAQDSPEISTAACSPARRDPTLDDALELYIKDRSGELAAFAPQEKRRWLNEKRRVVRYLTDALGKGQTVSTLTREDVRTFMACMERRGLGPASIKKGIQLSHAIVEVAFRELDINRRNPFQAHSVADPTHAREKRLPLSTDELRTVLGLSVNPELRTIATILVFTGARLKEITGLAWDDVKGLDTEQPFIEIRGNAVRGLKTKASKRAVPLLGPAADALRQHRRTAQDGQGRLPADGPVFRRYGRDGGHTAASAALMKALRAAGITENRKTIHSVRHAAKQRLRDVGCPKDVRDAIQGHASGDVAETYGLGHALTTMADWLGKALADMSVV